MHQNTDYGQNIALLHPLLCVEEGHNVVLHSVVTMVRGTPPSGTWLRSAKNVNANLKQP